MEDQTTEPGVGFTRRDLIRRGAVVGGTLMWAAPAVQTFSKAAFAQVEGSPCVFCVFIPGIPTPVGRCEATQACCDCLENPPNPLPGACDPVCVSINCVPTNVCP